MNKLIDLITDFNWLSVILRLVLAVILGGCIGSERGRHGRAAGLRTHILICVGAAMTSLTGLFVSETVGDSGDVFRISAQVISGIGFLGVGTILVRNNAVVTGLTTAAGLWATAAIGIAVGYGFYGGCIIATGICIFTATALSRFEKKRKNVLHLYAEISDMSRTGDIVREVKEMTDGCAALDITFPKSNCQGHVGLIIFIRNAPQTADFTKRIEQLEGVCFVVEENG